MYTLIFCFSCTGIIADPLPIKKRFFDPVQNFIVGRLLNLCLITRKDVAKECTKFILPLIVSSKNNFTHYSINYGCEAFWTGYFDGIDAIPKALVRYTCVEICYQGLGCPTLSANLKTRYKNNHGAFLIPPVLELVFKKLIGKLLDTGVDIIFKDEDEENMQDDELLF